MMRIIAKCKPALLRFAEPQITLFPFSVRECIFSGASKSTLDGVYYWRAESSWRRGEKMRPWMRGGWFGGGAKHTTCTIVKKKGEERVSKLYVTNRITLAGI